MGEAHSFNFSIAAAVGLQRAAARPIPSPAPYQGEAASRE
jgi:hypothetical protein